MQQVTHAPLTQIHHHLSQEHPHTHIEPDNNSYTSGPYTLPQSKGAVWSSENQETNPLPCCPTNKHCSQPHHHSPSRPSIMVCNPFSRPSNSHSSPHFRTISASRTKYRPVACLPFGNEWNSTNHTHR